LKTCAPQSEFGSEKKSELSFSSLENYKAFRARRSAEQDNLASTASVHKNRKVVSRMVKNVFSRFTKVVPAALVSISWLAFVIGIFITEPIAKIALLSLARVLP